MKSEHVLEHVSRHLSDRGQRQDGCDHRRIQQETGHVISSVCLCVFVCLQVMAEGSQSASVAQARSLSGSKHVGQWLLSKKQLVL